MSEIMGVVFKYLMVALGLTAVAGALYAALGSNKTTDAIANQTQLQANIQSAFGGQGNFTSLTNARVISGNLAPDAMVVAGALTNAWGGAVTVGPNATASNFDVTNAAVPQDGCQKFASSQKIATAISINNVAQTLPLDAGAAISACNAATNTVKFTYAR